MELVKQLFDTLIHLSPDSINAFVVAVGPLISYTTLFLIIFAETGLVVAPILPGDSLLFAVGAVAAHPSSPIHLGTTAVLLVIAAILGDAVNYGIGFYLGPHVFTREDSRLLNKKHLMQAHEFYDKYGGLTIILARFIPIVRTFAPFVAGIGKMNYFKFALYNVAGGTAWVLLFLVAGWWFGGLEVVKKSFHYVIAAIIVLSVVPAAYEMIRARLRKKHAPPAPEPE
jgi:membrane-associated protein